jgi:hypothetical protein
MEQVTHVLVSEREFTIVVFGNRGSQRHLKFHSVAFYNALEYLQQRMLRQHILYFY